MDNSLLTIDPKAEKQRIVAFLKKTFSEQRINKAVIGLSGGIDSTLSFFLLKEALPPENIIVAHIYYDKPITAHIEKIWKQARIPQRNIHIVSIKQSVDEIATLSGIHYTDQDRVRKGNIMARIRMIILFDLAKKYHALVCGTENKTENLLGYFTRFGDQASDIEPICYLYKTQVYQLGRSLGVPEEIINQHPSAGLWSGQTDEKEFGFSYVEADHVLYLTLEKHLSVEDIKKQGFKNAEKILERRKRNLFKHNTPYTLPSEK